MVDIRDFTSKGFIQEASKSLLDVGFVTDEHSFAPYRETLVTQCDEVGRVLKDSGFEFELGSGEEPNPYCGSIFYIFDKNKLSASQAKNAVAKWVNAKYVITEDDLSSTK